MEEREVVRAKAGLIGFEGKLVGLKEEVFRLRGESHGMKHRSPWLEGMLRMLEAEEDFLEPPKVGWEGEEGGLKEEAFGLKQPEPGLDGSPSSLQETASGMEGRDRSLAGRDRKVRGRVETSVALSGSAAVPGLRPILGLMTLVGKAAPGTREVIAFHGHLPGGIQEGMGLTAIERARGFGVARQDGRGFASGGRARGLVASEMALAWGMGAAVGRRGACHRD